MAMLWLSRWSGSRRWPATFLAGILAWVLLTPVLGLTRGAQSPVDEPQAGTSPDRTATQLSRELSRQPEAGVEPRQPEPPSPKTQSSEQPEQKRQLPEQPQASGAAPQAGRSTVAKSSSSSEMPARGWLTPAEWELLARVVHAEARGESLEGQVAVAAVILNRRDDPRFPHRIADIIYEPGAFEAVADGQINLEPDATAYRAVALALSGWDPTGGALYYWNPARATNRWIWSRPVVRVIGQHWFAR